VTPGLCLATANPAKMRELGVLVAGLGYEVRSLRDYSGVALPPEGATSYAENARAKARAARDATGTIALADDSGLEVDALGGAPGVASARYGGPGLTDAERVSRLLAAVAGAATRTARFRCVLALAAPWGAEALVEGVVEGLLTDAPRGEAGFGYDPIFFLPALGCTFAEVPAVDKHRWSHRGQAAAAARPILAAWAERWRARARPA
jgi:XTP/dITP diphosphohydrolase